MNQTKIKMHIDEARRLSAGGWDGVDIARHFGVSPSSVSRWLRYGEYPRYGVKRTKNLHAVVPTVFDVPAEVLETSADSALESLHALDSDIQKLITNLTLLKGTSEILERLETRLSDVSMITSHVAKLASEQNLLVQRLANRARVVHGEGSLVRRV